MTGPIRRILSERLRGQRSEVGEEFYGIGRVTFYPDEGYAVIEMDIAAETVHHIDGVRIDSNAPPLMWVDMMSSRVPSVEFLGKETRTAFCDIRFARYNAVGRVDEKHVLRLGGEAR